MRQLLPRLAAPPRAEGTSRCPDRRGLPDLTPDQLPRLQLFAYLALLIPLFGVLHNLTRESPRTEVRLVPETVPVIVEVPKRVERVVERIVYVPEAPPVESTETPAQPAPSSAGLQIGTEASGGPVEAADVPELEGGGATDPAPAGEERSDEEP